MNASSRVLSWSPTRISEANFRAKPPRPPNIEVPSLGTHVLARLWTIACTGFQHFLIFHHHLEIHLKLNQASSLPSQGLNVG